MKIIKLKNIFDYLENFKSNIAIIDDFANYTYEELIINAKGVSETVDKRSLAFIICDNSFESIVGYVGLFRSNVVQLLVGNSINIQYLSNLIEIYKPGYIFCPKDKFNITSDYKVILTLNDYILLKRKELYKYAIHEKLALLISTSGSTGNPKYVRLSYNNINSNTNAISSYLNIRYDDRVITTMPMNYTYGLSIINTHLYTGATIILNQKSLLNNQFWDSLNKNYATTFGGVPYIYKMLKKLKFHNMTLSSIKYLTQAGGKIDLETATYISKVCDKKNIMFYMMYGQAEATARIAYLPSSMSKNKLGSIGVAIPGGEIQLISDEGKTVKKPFETGEIIYFGKNVSMGYAQNFNELSKGDENKGTLYTGDLAHRDDDGYYYIVGRKKRFIKLYGNRFNLDDIEHALQELVQECACFEINESLIICIIKTIDERKIVELLSKYTGFTNIKYNIYITNNIPRSDSGKILYEELKNNYMKNDK